MMKAQKGFVYYIFDEINWMYGTLDSTEFGGISAPDCQYCETHIQMIEDSNVKITGTKRQFEEWEVHDYPGSPNVWVVAVSYTTLESAEWNLEKKLMTTIPANPKPTTLYFVVGHGPSGWVLFEGTTKRPVELIRE